MVLSNITGFTSASAFTAERLALRMAASLACKTESGKSQELLSVASEDKSYLQAPFFLCHIVLVVRELYDLV